MKLKLLVEIPDTPGQLVNILQPLSSFGANVSTIIHEHDNRTADGKIPVLFTLEASKEILKKGIDFIKEQDVDLLEIDGVLQEETLTFLLLGNLSKIDIMDTIHKIEALDDVKISDIDLNIGKNLTDSICKVVIKVINDRCILAMDTIQEIADKENLLLIREI